MKPLKIREKVKPDFLQIIEEHDRFFIIRLKGEISTPALEANREKMTALLDEHKLYRKNILCDFKSVTDSDTATLAVLINRFSELKKLSGNKLVLFNIHEELKELVGIAHLEELFLIRPSEAEAVTALGL